MKYFIAEHADPATACKEGTQQRANISGEGSPRRVDKQIKWQGSHPGILEGQECRDVRSRTRVMITDTAS